MKHSAELQINPESASSNWFIRHWRGEISLGEAYWLNGVLLANCLPALIVFGYDAGQPFSHSLRAGAAAAVTLRVLQITIWIWATVGIIRSANRHTARGGKLFWANAARVMVCLSVLATARDLQNDNIHTEILMAQIASGHDPMGRAVVESTSDGTAIVLQGRIGGGSADALQSVLDATPNATTLILDSKGGRITEAADIAIRVKQRQLDTMVRNQCLSACTYIFLAGMHRVATASSSLGFHQPSLPGQTPIGKWMSTQHMREYYRAAGLRDWFVDRVIATEPKDVWIPTKSDLAAAGVLTSPLGRP